MSLKMGAARAPPPPSLSASYANGTWSHKLCLSMNFIQNAFVLVSSGLYYVSY